MKEENIIQEKSYAFSLRIIKLYDYLVKNKKEYILSKQVLRSGTSIGANVEEAIGGHSKNDFSAKITIAYKEARETMYWLKLLRDGKKIDAAAAKSILKDCDEICRITASIQKSCNFKNL